MAPQPLDLNLLPEQYRPRRLSARVVLVIVAMAILVTGLLVTYRFFAQAQAETAVLETRVATLLDTLDQNQQTQKDAETTLTTLEADIEAAQSQMRQLRNQIEALQRQSPSQAADGIQTAIAALAPRIRLTQIHQTDTGFAVSGEAGSQALVLDYAHALENSGQFANVRITSIVNTDPLGVAPDVTFTIHLEEQ